MGAATVLLAAIVFGSSIGPAGPDWWRVPLELLNRLPLIDFDSGVSDGEWAIVWKIRMPRVVLGGLVGGMLSIAGAAYQVLLLIHIRRRRRSTRPTSRSPPHH